jgi:hypothetical protein
MSDEHSSQGNGGWKAGSKWAFWGFVAVAAYFLWTGHRAHVVQYLPLALLLACPLLHIFHHGGHGGHGDGAGENRRRRDSASDAHKHH